MFKLLRYFSLTSFVSVVIVAAILGLFYRELAVRSLITMGEANNLVVTRVLANSLWPKLMPYLATAESMPTDQLTHPDREVWPLSWLCTCAGLTVAKVKVFDMGGRTLFSTEPKQIGEDKSANAGFHGCSLRDRHERAHASRPIQRVRPGDRERRPSFDLHPGAADDRRRRRGGFRGLRRCHAVPGAHRAHAMDSGHCRFLSFACSMGCCS